MDVTKLPEGRLIVSGWEASFQPEETERAAKFLENAKIDFSECKTQAAVIKKAMNNGYGQQ